LKYLITMRRKGFGVEDAPFMILAAVAVMMLIIWIGINVMAQFVEGNEYQAAVEASTEIYKRAKLVSLGYDGSSDRIKVSIPQNYAIAIDGGSVVATGLTKVNESFTNATELTEPMSIQGIEIVSDGTGRIDAGDHDLVLTYSRKDAQVIISWH